jgi:hypothetical protein
MAVAYTSSALGTVVEKVRIDETLLVDRSGMLGSRNLFRALRLKGSFHALPLSYSQEFGLGDRIRTDDVGGDACNAGSV